MPPPSAAQHTGPGITSGSPNLRANGEKPPGPPVDPPGEHDRGAPAANGNPSNVISDGDFNILPPTTLNHPKAVAPAFVVFTFTDDGELKRRNVYLSLHSALKAKERAEARGSRFQLMLCELVPVPHKAIVVVGGGDQ